MLHPNRRALILGASAALALGPAAPRAQGRDALDGIAREAEGLDQLHAIVLLRHGETLLAEAFRGPGLDRPANVKSVSKTLLATLTGIAVERGALEGPDARVGRLLGRRFGDARDEITVGHLLSMRAGLASTSGPEYGAWVSSPDWVEAALDRPPVGRPGERFVYSTGGWHVLGAALSAATGLSLLEMARAWIGAPLSIEIPAWARDPQGRYLGGNEMALAPRALARFGAMIARGGTHEGARVVSRSWLDRSWEPRARSPWSGDRYGYGWFLTVAGGHEAVYARGYGGQLLMVVPSRGLSLAITSDPTRPARSGGHFGDLRAIADRAVSVAGTA